MTVVARHHGLGEGLCSPNKNTRAELERSQREHGERSPNTRKIRKLIN